MDGSTVTPITGEKITATNHDTVSATAITAKSEKVYCPTLDWARPIGRKPAMVTTRAGQHREGGRLVGIGGGDRLRIARLDPRHHRFDRDHRVVDEQAEGDDQRAERDALQADVGRIEEQEDDREHQRDRQRHHQPGAEPEAHEAHEQAR